MRAVVFGTERPHPLDPADARMSLDEAWRVLRDTMASVASFQRDYGGDALWVERCRRAEAELGSDSPPASLDLSVEAARDLLFGMIDLLLGQPKEAPYVQALAALRAHVGGPVFVADYVTQRSGVRQQSSPVWPGTGYTLVLTETPPGDIDAEAFSFRPDSQRRATRRQLFAAPLTAFQEGALRVAERIPGCARWDIGVNAAYVFGRDRTLARRWLDPGLAAPPRAPGRFRNANLEEAFVDPAMLSCTDDAALALAVVTRWLENRMNPCSCMDHLADLVDAVGRGAVGVLDALAGAQLDAPTRKRIAALRPIAEAS